MLNLFQHLCINYLFFDKKTLKQVQGDVLEMNEAII